MKKALLENRWLVMLAIVLLVTALIITMIPALQAEAQTGGGYCTSYHITYWSPTHGRYITEKRWRCTGHTRTRRFSRRGW